MVENIVDFAEIMMPKITWHGDIIERIQVGICVIVIWIYVNIFASAPIDKCPILNIITRRYVRKLRVQIAL
jgi:hypothetical protein